MMKRKNKTQFAILGLLNWQPMSGYAIKKIIELGLSQFWAESYGQIYPTLEKLVSAGLLTKTADSIGKRKRYTFHITTAGRQQFMDWLGGPTSPPQVRNEFQLKLFLASNLPLDHSLALLRDYQGQQASLLEHYRESERILSAAFEQGGNVEELDAVLGETSKKQLLFFLLSLRHGLRVVEARLVWCEESILLLEQGKKE